MFKNKFINNTRWMIISSLSQMVLSFFIGIITARYLGPNNYGIINYVSAFMSMAIPVVQLGLYGIVIKELTLQPEKHGEIIGSAIFMRFITGILSTIFIITIISFVSKSNLDSTLFKVSILQSISLLLYGYEIIVYWYQSQLMSKYTAVIEVIAYIVTSIFKIILLINQMNVVWFAFSFSLDLIVYSLMIGILYWKMGFQRLSVSITLCKQMFQKSKFLLLSVLIGSIYGQIDKVILKHYLDNTAVGLYSAAITVSTIWGFIPGAVIDSARPKIMEYVEVDKNIYIDRLKKLIAFCIWIGIIVVLLIILFAKMIINVLYGPDYIEIVNTLRIYSISIIFPYLGVIRTIWLICENKQKYEVYLAIYSTIISIFTYLIFIPYYGIEGAAIAKLITNISVNVIILFFIKSTREFAVYILDALRFKNILSLSEINQIKNKIKRG